ncbi:zinc finger RNA-binding protein isoform X2 [Corythoichthys intestinalis]|uniref:zinc finger RNA-binding protein isoform X2 n=1 Tax=Corythoichthys intestinalis TaxID=161448 RepID=UPI0025A5C551|nr:zinc finger RNA-binding protein isoform X2 [Corythoichthys intestinalis]
MASSNYFGFTHATGAQYSTQPTPAYSHPSTATYSVQQAPTVPHAVTASYSPATVQAAQPVVSSPYAYQSHQPPQDYNYRQPDPPAPPLPTTTQQTYQVYSDTDNYNYARPAVVTTYDNKQYYQTSIASAQRSTADNYYQTVGVKSAYTPAPTTAYSHPSPLQRQVTTMKPLTPSSLVSTSYNIYSPSSSAQQPQTSISSYKPGSTFSSTASATSYSGHSYSTYGSTGYTSTSATYYRSAQQSSAQPPHQRKQQPPPQQPQQQPRSKQLTSASWSNPGSNMVTTSMGSTYKRPAFHQNKLPKPKGPAKPPQLHYCDICKISCAGPQTYWEHLEGQKHKKKEAALKTGSQTGACNGTKGVQTHLRCELCDVSCTGIDAYTAHIRGAKHQKVLKLHTKLGKPIPSTEPVLVKTSTTTKLSGSSTDVASEANTAASTAAPKPSLNTAAKTITNVKKLVPSKLTLTACKPASAQAALTAAPPLAAAGNVEPTVPEDYIKVQGDIQPVGNDYVEEVHNSDGKVIWFHCKLCECSFNDPNAKDMHLKGRRHRLQYKRKVNPELPVEIKANNRNRKLQEINLKKQKALLKRQQEDQQRWHMEMRRYEEDMYWRRMEEEHMYWGEQRRSMAPPPLMSHPGMPVPPLLPCMRRPGSPDDRLVMAKHATIYPGEELLQAVQRIVSHSERALKMVSDNLFEENTSTAATENEDVKSTGTSTHLLKGVMRAGILAKGLLLRGDTNVHLILLTIKKPTVSLLMSIAKQLPKEMATFSEDQYEVQAHPEEANIVIISSKEPIMRVTISLTSPLMRDDPAAEKDKQAGGKAAEKDVADNDPTDLLNRQKCLEHLATLRHAKWFQARANGLQSCVIIIRVLRDLSQRVPVWAKVPSWAMELLVEKVIGSATGPLSPGEALRRVLECMATGILLSDGSGLLDPCEREPTDVLESMKVQDREDVTASAQHALRLLAFRQIHEVLGMDSGPVTKAGVRIRKRRRDASDISDGEVEGKKDKKEEEVMSA